MSPYFFPPPGSHHLQVLHQGQLEHSGHCVYPLRPDHLRLPHGGLHRRRFHRYWQHPHRTGEQLMVFNSRGLCLPVQLSRVKYAVGWMFTPSHTKHMIRLSAALGHPCQGEDCDARHPIRSSQGWKSAYDHNLQDISGGGSGCLGLLPRIERRCMLLGVFRRQRYRICLFRLKIEPCGMTRPKAGSCLS